MSCSCYHCWTNEDTGDSEENDMPKVTELQSDLDRRLWGQENLDLSPDSVTHQLPEALSRIALFFDPQFTCL